MVLLSMLPGVEPHMATLFDRTKRVKAVRALYCKGTVAIKALPAKYKLLSWTSVLHCSGNVPGNELLLRSMAVS